MVFISSDLLRTKTTEIQNFEFQISYDRLMIIIKSSISGNKILYLTTMDSLSTNVMKILNFEFQIRNNKHMISKKF